jgi:Tol biopolymer transport system component
VSDDELRRRIDDLATEAPSPDDRRARTLARARRRARAGVAVAGVLALAVAAGTVFAIGTVLERREPAVIGPAPSGTVRPDDSVTPSPPPAPTGQLGFWSDSPTGGSARFILLDADGGGRDEIGDLSVSTSRLSWSPDGTRGVFDHGTGEGSGQLDVLIDVGTGETETIFVVGAPTSPDWSPDGERIVFTTDSAALFTIPAGGASGGEAVRRLGPNEFLRGLYPSWSPDGREIAFLDPASGAVSVVAVDGRSQPRIVFADGGANSLDWGPGGIVASVSEADGGSSLYLIDPEGDTTPERLTTRPGDEVQPSVSPDGAFVAYAGTAGGQQDIYVLRVADGRTWQLTNDAGQDFSPAWRPVS